MDAGGNGYYNTSTYGNEDLAGNHRIEDVIDMGAYELKKLPLCEVRIQANKTADVRWGDWIEFSVENEGAVNIRDEFQWQGSLDGHTWTDISGATLDELKTQVKNDSPLLYRMQITRNNDVCYTNVISLSLAPCSISYELVGPSVRKLSDKVYEVQAGSSFSVKINSVNATITSASLEKKLLQREVLGTATVADRVDATGSWYFDFNNLDDSYDLKLSYNSDCGSLSNRSFIVRPIYQCTSTNSEVIWFDNFGDISSSRGQYTYTDYSNPNNLVTRTVNADSRSCDGENFYSVKDYQNAVVEHAYGYTSSYGHSGDGDVQDGHYAILENSIYSMCGSRDQTGNFADHTTGRGAMLFVNFAKNSRNTKIYRRPFSVKCDDAYVIISVYIANANKLVNATWEQQAALEEVNLRMDIRDGVATNAPIVARAYTGNIQSRDACPEWHNLSARFKAQKGHTYYLELTNNKNGGAGNDALIDDISITVCYPEVAVSDKPDYVLDAPRHLDICGRRSTEATLYVNSAEDVSKFYDTPTYLFQYEESDGVWKNLDTVPPVFSTEDHYTISTSDARLSNGMKLRAFVAKDSVDISSVIAYYNSHNKTYPDPTCDLLYGVFTGYTVSFFPGMGSLDNVLQAACPSDIVTLESEGGAGFVEFQWYDKDMNMIEGATTSSYSFEMGKTTQTYILVASAENNVCPDTAVYRTSLKRDVSLICSDTTLYSESNGCFADYELKLPDVLVCGAEYISYKYRKDPSSAFVDYVNGAHLTVMDGDDIEWSVIVDGDASLADMCTQHVTVVDTVRPEVPTFGDVQALMSGDCQYEIPDLRDLVLASTTDNCEVDESYFVQSPSAASLYPQTSSEQRVDVSVEVKDVSGNIRMATITVVIPANELLAKAPDDVSVCRGASVLLSSEVENPNGDVSYVWSNGSTSKDITVSPNTTTTYEVTVTDANGCTSSDDVTVTVNPLVELSATNLVQTVCVNVSIMDVVITSANAIVTTNTLPIGLTFSNGRISGTPTTPGNYSVTITANSDQIPACESKTLTFSLVVNPLPTFSATKTDVLCKNDGNGSISVLSTSGSMPCQYSIDDGDNYQLSNVFNDLVPGSYGVKIKDGNGCESNTSSISITEPNALSVSISAPEEGCPNREYSFNALVTGGTTPYVYQWSGDLYGTSSSAVLSTVKECKSYSVRLHIEDANGCVANASDVTFTTVDAVAPTISGTLAPITVTGCGQSDVPAATNTIAYLTANGLTISDNCTANADLTVTSSDAAMTGTCAKTVIRTYTVTDKCGNSSTATQTITVNIDATITMTGGTNNKTVECLADVVAPDQLTPSVMPTVTDACGTPLENPVYVRTPNISGCEGTVTYTYTYMNCDGKSRDWTFTYTVKHSTAPKEEGTPVSTSSTVQCLADATAPTTLPVVKDVCGNTLTAPDPVVTDNPASLTCEGTRTYTYTYEDCAGKTFVWVYTYNIEKNAPVIASEGYATSSYITCIDEDITPTSAMIPSATNSCGEVVTPTMVRTTDWSGGKENCTGKIIYTYTYTDCGESSVWTYTYNLNDNVKPTFNAISPLTVNCSAADRDATISAWLNGVTATDNCGTPTVTNNYASLSLPASGCGTVEVTFTAMDACGNTSTTTADIVVEDNTAPVIGAVSDLTLTCDDTENDTKITSWL
ncbi:MAG: putative Ig domain-containing protein, partial [Paludibacteraceae bacterium]|nr:putative Ig domain-containing protein [Paludibacteraceae bacterium]